MSTPGAFPKDLTSNKGKDPDPDRSSKQQPQYALPQNPTHQQPATRSDSPFKKPAPVMTDPVARLQSDSIARELKRLQSPVRSTAPSPTRGRSTSSRRDRETPRLEGDDMADPSILPSEADDNTSEGATIMWNTLDQLTGELKSNRASVEFLDKKIEIMYARQTQKLEQHRLTAETTRTKYQVDNVEGKANLLASRIDRLERESVIVPTVQTDAPMARPPSTSPEEDYHPRGAGGGGGDPDGDDDSDPDSRDGNRRHNRNLSTHVTPAAIARAHTTLASPVLRAQEAVKIKRDDIGLFGPASRGPERPGVVQDGKTLIYTDASRAILSFFQTLLAGSAVIWWNTTSTACGVARDDRRDADGYRRSDDRHGKDLYRRDDYRRNDRDRERGRDDKRPRVHYADQESSSGENANHADNDSGSSSDSDYSSATNSDSAYTAYDSTKTCHKCHLTFDTISETDRHAKQCGRRAVPKNARRQRANDKDPARRTCGHCATVWDSRNALFKHEPATAFSIKDAPTIDVEKDLNSPRSSFTHLRVMARAAPDEEDVEVCMDPGASGTIIGLAYLNTLEHTIERRKGNISGIGKAKTNKWATFTFFMPGVEDGKPTMLKFTRSGWVMDTLSARLLLGADFLDPYGADINYGTKTVTLQNANFSVPFRTRRMVFPAYASCRHQPSADTAALPQPAKAIPAVKPPEPSSMAYLDDLVERKPIMPEKLSTLGIKMPDDLPEIIAEEEDY
ncbi:hypothetical protein N0V88_008224 [Collariella sp. IMI 366227]|nr:hypothetical protein N0V88_008224 [Collariella sp. IMI 366227]